MDDLDGIMEVEREEFGTLGEDTMASRETMARRIEICNSEMPGWFWVALWKKKVVGDIILQPTSLTPQKCTSWNQATDNGTLERTFDPMGANIYVVSLTASGRALSGTSDMLMHTSLVAWARHRGYYMFCSRLPGFAKTHKETGISIEDYWKRKGPDGGPENWMLHLYWEMSGGVAPLRLLKDGFPPDVDSGGHGVLFALNDPYKALFATTAHLYRAALIAGIRIGRHERNSVTFPGE